VAFNIAVLNNVMINNETCVIVNGSQSVTIVSYLRLLPLRISIDGLLCGRH